MTQSDLACDEDQLLIDARRLDLSALSHIHDCFYELLYRYAHRRTGDGQLAEDTASEVFVRLLDALQQGKSPRQSLRGWLFGTASHIVDDYFRHHYRLRKESLDAHTTLKASSDTDPEHRLQLNLTEERLRAALTQLTPEQQHVIALRFGQGLSHREVAQVVDKSEGAVKLLQFRAMQTLRDLLDPSGTEAD